MWIYFWFFLFDSDNVVRLYRNKGDIYVFLVGQHISWMQQVRRSGQSFFDNILLFCARVNTPGCWLVISSSATLPGEIQMLRMIIEFTKKIYVRITCRSKSLVCILKHFACWLTTCWISFGIFRSRFKHIVSAKHIRFEYSYIFFGSEMFWHFESIISVRTQIQDGWISCDLNVNKFICVCDVWLPYHGVTA